MDRNNIKRLRKLSPTALELIVENMESDPPSDGPYSDRCSIKGIGVVTLDEIKKALEGRERVR